jgi:hypothetical protein
MTSSPSSPTSGRHTRTGRWRKETAPTPRRPTPIATTALRFRIQLDPEGVVRLRLIG